MLKSMDNFTATMGLPSEITIQEGSEENFTQRFPGLINILAYNLESMSSMLKQISQMLTEISLPRFGFSSSMATHRAVTFSSRGSAASITARPQGSYCASTTA
jgi:hypothetical protein